MTSLRALLLLLLAVPAAADDPRVELDREILQLRAENAALRIRIEQGPRPAAAEVSPVMRIRVKFPGQGYSIASCCCVGPAARQPQAWVFLTAAHVVPASVEDVDIEIGEVWTETRDVHRWEARDVAVLYVDSADQLPHAVTARLPSLGSDVTVSGLMSGSHAGRLTRAGAVLLDDGEIVAPGDSGGAVLDSDGRYLGTFHSYANRDNRQAEFTPWEEISGLFAQVEPHEPIAEPASDRQVVTMYTSAGCGHCIRFLDDHDPERHGYDVVEVYEHEFGSVPRFEWTGSSEQVWSCTGYISPETLGEWLRRYD